MNRRINIFKWLMLTAICVNVLMLASGFGSVINWLALGLCAISYISISGVIGWKEGRGDILSMLPVNYLLDNFGASMSLVGWLAYSESKGYISNRPYLEFAQEAYHNAPEFIRYLARKNEAKCFELWP